jgi:hypothetical protein
MGTSGFRKSLYDCTSVFLNPVKSTGIELKDTSNFYCITEKQFSKGKKIKNC